MALSRAEKELRLFWRVVNEGVTNTSLADYQNELEGMARHTQSATLRTAALRAMHRFDHLGTTRLVAAR